MSLAGLPTDHSRLLTALLAGNTNQCSPQCSIQFGVRYSYARRFKNAAERDLCMAAVVCFATYRLDQMFILVAAVLSTFGLSWHVYSGWVAIAVNTGLTSGIAAQGIRQGRCVKRQRRWHRSVAPAPHTGMMQQHTLLSTPVHAAGYHSLHPATVMQPH